MRTLRVLGDWECAPPLILAPDLPSTVRSLLSEMGALCGKEDHFDALERHGKGNKLSGSTSSSAPTSSASASAAAGVAGSGGKGGKPGAAASGPPRSVSTSPPQRLGGGAEGTSRLASATAAATEDDAAARREAMLAAAEARNKASATRGTKNGGKLTQQLERQARDGGRADEARREAERKGNEPLVWD